MKYTLFVLWCCVYFAKSDDGYEFVRPTPVVMPIRIQSTNALNPLKLNVQTDLKALTTGGDVLFQPATVKQIQTPDVTKQLDNFNDLIIIRSTTTVGNAAVDNFLANPTPVLNTIPRLETGRDNPVSNIPLTRPLSTAVVGNDVIAPTPVILAIGTKPASLSNEDKPELPSKLLPSTGNTAWNIIEPSHVSINNVAGSVTGAYTSQIDQGFKQVPSSESISAPITQSVAPCTCKYYEENPTPALGIVSYDTDNALTPQSLIHEKGQQSNDQNVARPPLDIRQLIVNLQLNLYVNNVPVLLANAVPLYFF